jgi:hypothetical protein
MKQERALLLEAANRVELDLAVNLLEEEGIPCVIEGPDFDVAELGRAAHDTLRGQNLYVPRSALERARAILDRAWSEAPDAQGDVPGETPGESVPREREVRSEASPPVASRGKPWTILALVVLVLVLGYLWIDARETVLLATRSDPLFELEVHDDHLSWTWRSTGHVAMESFDEDLNGTAERTLTYDRDGILSWEGNDLDQDGLYETLKYFDREGRLYAVREDLDGDDRPERFVEHRRSGVRIEWTDADGDGSFERRELYDADGQLVRIEEDRELDGWVELPR